MSNTNLGFQFDSNQVEPNQGARPPIPKGIYKAIITDSEIKPTSNGTGAFVEAQFKVIEGPYAGHVIYHNYNIRNQSQKAMEIGFGQLSATCRAAGVPIIQDTTQLHNRPMDIGVKIGGGGQKPDGGTYDERNEITSWNASGAASQPSGSAPIIPPMAPTQASPMEQPWNQQAPAAQSPDSVAPQFQPTTQPWEQQGQQAAPQQPPTQQQPANQQTQNPVQPWQTQNPVQPPTQQQQPASGSQFVPPWMQNSGQ